MSAESGISTFRDSDGLWENHRIEDVASPEGFKRNPKLVLDFYNARRKQLFEVEPNEAHKLIAQLEENFIVDIITQNVDDLHERAGSTKVLHLHGELRKARSTKNEKHCIAWDADLNEGELCPDGHQMRPHIVWFGEMVPEIENAMKIVQKADIVVVVGTSMQVYPAAGLVYEASSNADLYFIDPNPNISGMQKVKVFAKTATEGMKELVEILMK